jgi:hypothetical protein
MTPSPGEVIDRMAILELKIKHSERKEFRDEKESLHKYLASKEWVIPNELHQELAKINTRLWVLEDNQRDILKALNDKDPINWPMQSQETYLCNAVIVTQLNDARAETVRRINASCGIDSVEKLFV